MEESAQEVSTKLQFNYTDDLFALARKLGGRISVGHTSQEDVHSGSILMDKDAKFEMFTSPFISIGRGRFTIAYKLGHFFLHYPNVREKMGNNEIFRVTRYADLDDKGQQVTKREVNWLAASLSMPGERFKQIYKRGTVDAELEFQVDTSVVNIRVKSFGLLQFKIFVTPHESVKPTVQESIPYEVPAHRVRLFLSIDLTGSIAFKYSKSSPLEWLEASQQFYRTFPRKLSGLYQRIEQSAGLSDEELGSGSPKLWKIVGGEILLHCKIESVYHVSICIEASIQTLQQFREVIQRFNLNTKGNTWVVSFPTPNSSIIPISTGDSATDFLSGNSDLVSEEMGEQADLHPNRSDFSEEGTNSGPRISKSSSIGTLTISPGLSVLLLDAR